MRAGDARAGSGGSRRLRDVGAAEGDVPLVGRERAGEDVQQRRLAGPVGADDADRLAGRHREIDAVRAASAPNMPADPDGREDRPLLPCADQPRVRHRLASTGAACLDRDVLVVGVLADDELEVERLPFGALRHWLPMIGVATTFGHWPLAPVRGCPTGVCT